MCCCPRSLHRSCLMHGEADCLNEGLLWVVLPGQPAASHCGWCLLLCFVVRLNHLLLYQHAFWRNLGLTIKQFFLPGLGKCKQNANYSIEKIFQLFAVLVFLVFFFTWMPSRMYFSCVLSFYMGVCVCVCVCVCTYTRKEFDDFGFKSRGLASSFSHFLNKNLNYI